MRKNVYMKSMLRKPVRSLILFFLISIAIFSFILRSAEFLSVREEIFRVATFYTAIGFLSGEHDLVDVNVGADFLENTGYLELSDRRRGASAALQGILNADVYGANFLNFQDFPEYQWRFHDAFFTVN